MSALDTLNRAGLDMIEPPVEIDMLREYWRDAAPFEAEREAARTQCHAAIDVGMAALNARQAERWAREQGL